MRFFRFTLRDLLSLTVVVAMGLGWWMDHRRAEQEYVKLGLENAMLRLQANWKKEWDAGSHARLPKPPDVPITKRFKLKASKLVTGK